MLSLPRHLRDDEKKDKRKSKEGKRKRNLKKPRKSSIARAIFT